MDITVFGRQVRLTLSNRSRYYSGSIKVSGITIKVYVHLEGEIGKYVLHAELRNRRDHPIAYDVGAGSTIEAAEQDLKKRVAERVEAYRVMQAELG